MPIETHCPGCQRKLRLADEHAGQQACCPACGVVLKVPEPPPPTIDPRDRWSLITPDGYRYGPVSQQVVESWVAEGRVDHHCEVHCEADGVWRKAPEVFAALQPPKNDPTPLTWHASPATPGMSASWEQPAATSAAAPLVIYESRGGFILSLGIISWATGCPLFGIVAWLFGTQDLAEIARGTMDPSGRGWTEAGRWIGMLHTFVAFVVLIVGGFAVLVIRFL